MSEPPTETGPGQPAKTRFVREHFRGRLSLKLVGAVALAMLIFFPSAVSWVITCTNQLLLEQYHARARTVGQMLDAMLVSRQVVTDNAATFGYLQRVLWLEPDVVSVQLSRPENGALVVVSATQPGKRGQRPEADNQTAFENDQVLQRVVEENGHRLLRTITPIHVSRDVVGTIQSDFTLEVMDTETRMQFYNWVFAGAVAALLVIGLLILLLDRLVLKPVHELGQAVADLAEGRHVRRLPNNRHDELGALSDAFNRMTSELKAAEARIEHLAYHDSLTGLANRRLFLDRLDQVVAHCARYGRYAALIYLDLDEFKRINDDYGHLRGDAVLRETARRLTASTRQVDTVARLGGDEFVVLVSELPAAEAEAKAAVETIGAKILEAFEPKMRVSSDLVTIRLSAGVRLVGPDELSASEVLGDADSAMYMSKAEGLGRLGVFGEVASK